MTDMFRDRTTGLESPAEFASLVTPDDGADLANACRALFVGGAGDVHVMTVGGDEVTFVSVQNGILPVRVQRVYATGTTATNLIAVW